MREILTTNCPIEMIRPILKYGAEELERKSAPVETFDDDLEQLAADLLETMYAAPGIGLAAPQVGINIRLIVVDITAGEEAGHQLVLVNPEVVDSSGSHKDEEGCLSIPGFTAMVKRPQQIRVKAQNLEGEALDLEAEDLLARALCHEIDHLDGILYLDRIYALKRDMIRRKIRRMMKNGEW